MAGSLAELVKALGARNTFDTQDQLFDACDSLIDEFPALKMEEVAIVFKWLRQGKLLPDLYGTFRERELLDAFRKYEGEVRAPHLEKSHHVSYHHSTARRTSSKLKDEPAFRPILATKEDLQAIGIWPTESSSQSESSPSPQSGGSGTSQAPSD